MSTPVACEVALRCTSPEGPARVCSFYVTYDPVTPGYPRWCKYASTPAGFCGHPQARLIAFREAMSEAFGFLPDLSPPLSLPTGPRGELTSTSILKKGGS